VLGERRVFAVRSGHCRPQRQVIGRGDQDDLRAAFATVDRVGAG
jgi:hypothetical protein